MATNVFYMPPVSFIGRGCMPDGIKHLAKTLNPKKVFIVTGSQISKPGGIVSKVEAQLKYNNVDYVVWPGAVPNPTMACVDAGVKAYRDNGCDVIVAVGGGSNTDTAKAIGAVITNGGSAKTFEGLNKLTRPIPPLVAINTTSGTASEMTRFSVITEDATKVKMVLVDDKMQSTFDINDTELHELMPGSLVAATGMDALTHATEALVSAISYDLPDLIGLQACNLIHKYLRKSVAGDMNARDKMVTAEFLAGMAFNSGGLGYVHAMAHQLGGFFNWPHGVCNAILLPHVCEFNLGTRAEKFKQLAEAFEIKTDGLSAVEAGQKAIAYIRQLSADIGIPSGLRSYKPVGGELPLDESAIPTLAKYAVLDICGTLNPRQASVEEVIGIFKAAL